MNKVKNLHTHKKKKQKENLIEKYKISLNDLLTLISAELLETPFSNVINHL